MTVGNEAQGKPLLEVTGKAARIARFPCGTRVFAIFYAYVTKILEGRAIRQPEASSAPFLGRLTLRNYRNFERFECEFPETGVAIVGLMPMFGVSAAMSM